MDKSVDSLIPGALDPRTARAGDRAWAFALRPMGVDVARFHVRKPMEGMLLNASTERACRLYADQGMLDVTHFVPFAKDRPDKLAWSRAARVSALMFSASESDAYARYNDLVARHVASYRDAADRLEHLACRDRGYRQHATPLTRDTVLSAAIYADKSTGQPVALDRFLEDVTSGWLMDDDGHASVMLDGKELRNARVYLWNQSVTVGHGISGALDELGNAFGDRLRIVWYEK